MNTRYEKLAVEFLSNYFESGRYERDRIDELTALALSGDRNVAEPATRAFFVLLVERLADSFDPRAVSLYNRVFSQAIQLFRKDSRASLFDRELARFGLDNETEIVERAEALSRTAPAPPRDFSKVKLVIVLSRVTLGADVAITSVILARMKSLCPEADIVLVGGKKMVELFGGDARLQFKQIDYGRGGLMSERLLAWLDLLECTRAMTRDLTAGEFIVVDPDSRLTQLGLLPLAESSTGARSEYLFFPSRAYGHDMRDSLSELTNRWLNEVLSAQAKTYPFVCLNQEDKAAARKLVKRVRGESSRPVVAMNFGVGENPLKRVGAGFEAALIDRVLQRGAAIVLDKGSGDEETARVSELIDKATRVEREGRLPKATEIDEHTLEASLDRAELGADILVWNGRIGMLAALIGESDLYIGYDSAGQHIAAALGVSCVDVFAGYSSARMLDRWRPTGRARVQVIPVDTSRAVDAEELAGKILLEWKQNEN